MGYDRNKVIKIAEQEVGYLEKSKTAYQKYGTSILYEKTKGAGYDNYTKYGLEMHKIYPTVMDFPAPYCDTFVDWCFYKAYGKSTAVKLLDGNFNDYTVASAQQYQKYTALNHTPEVGSQIFFTKNGKVSGCYHTGLVIAVSADKKTVTTIEGNTSAGGTNIVANGGCVAKKTRRVGTNTLFGHPYYNDDYGKAITNNATSTTTDTPYTTAHRFDKSLAGKYKLTVSALNLRKGSNTNQDAIAVIPKTDAVQCYGYYNLNKGTKWLYVAYGSKAGFISSKCVTKA